MERKILLWNIKTFFCPQFGKKNFIFSGKSFKKNINFQENIQIK